MKTLKVGGHTYELMLEPNKDGDCGEVDYVASTITINPDMQLSMRTATLIHEALHAMNPTLGEEHLGHALLDSLAEQLYHFLSENELLDQVRLALLLR